MKSVCNYVNAFTAAIEEWELLLGRELHANWLHGPIGLSASVFQNYLERQTFHGITLSWKLLSCHSLAVSPCTQGFAHFSEGVAAVASWHLSVCVIAASRHTGSVQHH